VSWPGGPTPHNDKIVVRLWSTVTGLSSNYFIASIPEHPGQHDPFNITVIHKQSSERSTGSRWINLYGPDPKDRGPRTKGRRDGSMWLGRVLMGFNIQMKEKPDF
jgi:hypothetical protein